MNNLLLVWTVFLTVLTTLNLALCLAVIRRLKNHETPGHDQLPDLLAPGTPIAEFNQSTMDGGTITAATLEEPALVAFLMPGCEPCADTVTRLRQRRDSERTFLIVVDESIDGEARRYATGLLDLGEVAVARMDSAIVRAFGDLTGFPALFRVADGVITASHRRLDSLAAARQPVRA